MNTEIADMLDEQYQDTLEEIALARAGSEEAEWLLKKLAELHKQRMAEQKILNDVYIQGSELNLKEKAAKENRKDQIIKIVLAVWDAGTMVLVPFYCFCKGIKFEETGTFTSRAGQVVGNFFKLFKK